MTRIRLYRQAFYRLTWFSPAICYHSSYVNRWILSRVNSHNKELTKYAIIKNTWTEVILGNIIWYLHNTWKRVHAWNSVKSLLEIPKFQSFFLKKTEADPFLFHRIILWWNWMSLGKKTVRFISERQIYGAAECRDWKEKIAFYIHQLKHNWVMTYDSLETKKETTH